MSINETSDYKYLGDVLTSNGKNLANLDSRKKKTQATTTNINAIASTEILRKIEVPVLLRLHETITIAGLITNSESWCLSKTETDELEKIEIQALKSLLDLPIHQPTPSIIYSLGTLYTGLRVNQKQLIYLHRILNRPSNHWTRKVLECLEVNNIGWYKTVKKTLQDLDLPNDFTEISSKTTRDWERLVKQKIEIKNRQRLIDDCYKKVNGVKTIKSKTAHILQHLSDDNYSRQPCQTITNSTKQHAKTIMIARFRMLECGVNFKGTLSEICRTCKTKDDENHRMNHCVKYRAINLYDSDEKTPFELIYSRDETELSIVVKIIEKVWNTKSAHGNITK